MGKIVIELTNRCNLHCQHCPSGRHGGGNDLELSTLERLLEQARENGFNQLAFTGGDPTIHPAFDEVLRLTHDAGYQFGLVTNGVSFKRVFPSIERYRENLAVITFSLDGAAEATHDQIRGTGSYRKVMQAISICVIRRLPFTFNMVVTSHNHHEIRPMAQLAAELGSRGLRFGHLMPTPVTASQNLDLSPAGRKAVESEIWALRKEHRIPIAMAPGFHTTDLFPCDPLRTQEINVDCFGNLTLCCHLSGHGSGVGDGDVAGNLADASLTELLETLALKRGQLRQHKEERWSNGTLLDSDFFPCWYCSLHFRKADWLKEHQDHPWAKLMWESPPALVHISATPRKEAPHASADQ